MRSPRYDDRSLMASKYKSCFNLFRVHFKTVWHTARCTLLQMYLQQLMSELRAHSSGSCRPASSAPFRSEGACTRRSCPISRYTGPAPSGTPTHAKGRCRACAGQCTQPATQKACEHKYHVSMRAAAAQLWHSLKKRNQMDTMLDTRT